MRSFEAIGLREELLRTLEDEDVQAPTDLQQAVVPALRRGGNLVARASSGSGKTLAYALGILDRLRSDEDPERTALRMLVLTPTAEDAENVALSLVPYVQSVGFQIVVPGTSWGLAAEEANVLVAAAGEIMEAVRSSAVKLDDLEAVVVDGAASILNLGDWEHVDAVLDLVPRDAQRVVVSSAVGPEIEDLIERRVKRALRYPSEPAIEGAPEPPTEGRFGYLVAPDREKLQLLAGQLSQREKGGPPPIVFCRTDERAADLAERLTIRGFVVGAPDEEDADVAIVSGGLGAAELIQEVEGDLGQTISFDVPPDATTLRRRHAEDPDAVVMVEPRELPHLREIARQGKLSARATPAQRDQPRTAAELRTFREELRSAVRQEDLAAQMLVLEPLFEEFTAAELAAAASALLRARRPAAAASGPEEAPVPRAVERSAPGGPAPVTWARLFVSVGARDEIRPGDLVGALAGEANIAGSKIGKIEIRDSFSIVEVQSDVADTVIRAVNGTTMKGRSLRVDYDRGGPARRPSPRGGPPRRTTRPPPGG